VTGAGHTGRPRRRPAGPGLTIHHKTRIRIQRSKAAGFKAGNHESCTECHRATLGPQPGLICKLCGHWSKRKLLYWSKRNPEMKSWKFHLANLALVLFPVTLTHEDCKFQEGKNITGKVIHISLSRVGQNDLKNAMNCLHRAQFEIQHSQNLTEVEFYISAAMLSIPHYARLFVLASAYEV
jgi:hypothetical protein